jgi:hypothetical protein
MEHVKLYNIAWAAGLIEGEGCFTWHSEGKHPYFLMDMTDRDVLEKFQLVFPFVNLRGPYTHKNKPLNKPRWRVDAFGSKAIQIMEAILPYMGKRRTCKIKEFLPQVCKEVTMFDTYDDSYFIDDGV